jgi:arylsulfatase A-like enzyme
LIVRWPDHIRPGTSCNVPTIHVDLYATLLELGSAPKPNQVLDGQSILPLMLDQQGFTREAIYQHFPGYLGAGVDAWRTTPVSTICMGNWKLMEFLEDGRLELYDLDADIGESKNLAQSNPAKAKELYQRLVAWRKEIHAPMPTLNDGTNLPKIKKQKDEP